MNHLFFYLYKSSVEEIDQVCVQGINQEIIQRFFFFFHSINSVYEFFRLDMTMIIKFEASFSESQTSSLYYMKMNFQLFENCKI